MERQQKSFKELDNVNIVVYQIVFTKHKVHMVHKNQGLYPLKSCLFPQNCKTKTSFVPQDKGATLPYKILVDTAYVLQVHVVNWKLQNNFFKLSQRIFLKKHK